MEIAIGNEIECELSDALKFIHEKTLTNAELRQEYSFIFNWNAQVNYTFYVDEQSTLNPTLSFLNHAQIFTLGLNASNKSDATRTDKFTLVYKVGNLIKGPQYPCGAPHANPGTVFVTSELNIREWLIEAIDMSVAQSHLPGGGPTYPKQATAISHEVKFDIVSSGSVSPSWKLVQFGAGSSPLLSGSRDRYQDLLLTLGPPDKANPSDLGPAGQTSVLSSQLNNAVSTFVRTSP